MSNWERVPLGEIATRVTDKNVDGHDRVMTVAAGRGLVEQETYFSKRVASKDLSTYYVLEDGDFVYNKSTSATAQFGVVARYSGDVPGVVTPLYFAFRARADRVCPEYLLLAANGREFFESLSGRLREGARAHGLLNVRIAEFYSATIALPPMNEQRRIVDLIASVDNLIEASAKEVERLDQWTEAMRSDLLAPQAHWVDTTVGDVAVTATGRAFPDRYQGVPDGDTPYFKVADMNAPGNERELRSSPNWLTPEARAEMKPRICPPGTVVFPIIGAAMLTEKRRVLAQESAFDQNVMGLVLSDRVTSDFMLAAMSKVRLGELAQGGAVPSVNQRIVAAIPLSLPPLAEQQVIGTELAALYDHADAVRDGLARLRMFRSALLTSLLKQDVEIPESYDVLLEAAS